MGLQRGLVPLKNPISSTAASPPKGFTALALALRFSEQYYRRMGGSVVLRLLSSTESNVTYGITFLLVFIAQPDDGDDRQTSRLGSHRFDPHRRLEKRHSGRGPSRQK